MDITELRKQPHLSSSSITSYMMCGLCYKFSKIDKRKPEFISDNLVFGSAIHEVLSEYNQEKLAGMLLSIGELQDMFEKYWKKEAKGNENIKYSNNKNYQQLLHVGKNLIKTFIENLPNDNFTILAVEEPFQFSIEGLDIPIIGIMDLVEENNDDGSIIITDYKTAAKSYSIDNVDNNLQLTLYYMAAKRNGFSDREVQLKFDCIIKTAKPKFEQIYTYRDIYNESRAICIIMEVTKGINNKVFIPNDQSWKCKNHCEYKNYCDDWLEKGGLKHAKT